MFGGLSHDKTPRAMGYHDDLGSCYPGEQIENSL